MMTYAIAGNSQRKDDENDRVDETVDGTHAQGRTTWHLFPDFPGDRQNPRLIGAFDFLFQVNLVFDVAKAAGHRHYLVAGVAASDSPLERLVGSSLGRRRFDERGWG
jgi:hypothetical protein